MNCKKCGNPLPNHANFCKICGTVQDDANHASNRPMDYYKFLISFGLPAAGLGYLIAGILYLFGILRTFDYTSVAYADWGSTYSVTPFLRALDIPFGLCYLGMLAFLIVVYVKLLKYQQGAPNCYIAFHLTALVLSIALGFIDYGVRLSIAEQTDVTAPSPYLFFPLLFAWIFLHGLLIWATNKYFKNRADQFDA